MAAENYSGEQIRVKLAEYEAAQDMLKHYDTLNWQIGSILIGANAVLLGLVVGLLGKVGWLGMLVAAGVAAFSFVLLESWWRWFYRHKVLYDFRNETLQRIEVQLGMYHFLRVVEAQGGDDRQAAELQLPPAHAAAYAMPDGSTFRPIYSPSLDGTTSGNQIAKTLRWLMPALEFVALALVVVAQHG